MPTLWLRNTWGWGRHGEGYDPRGLIERIGERSVRVTQPTLGHLRLDGVDRRLEALVGGHLVVVPVVVVLEVGVPRDGLRHCLRGHGLVDDRGGRRIATSGAQRLVF